MSRRNLYILLLGLTLAGYGWLAWNSVGQHDDTTICIFKAVTGVPCPSCGTTRALIVLTKGEYRESLMVNPFGVGAALVLFFIPLWVLSDIFRKKDSLYRSYRQAERYVLQNRWVVVLGVVVVVLNWVWNITKSL